MSEGQPGGGRERRAAPRYRARGPVCFTTEDTEGRGMLHDVSLLGALIEDASPRLKKGTRLELRFSPRPDCLPIRVKAEVKRETENGFAVEFTFVDRGLKKLLEALVRELAEEPALK